MERKKILISNDDGINSKGLAALIEVACEFGDVLVVAPDGARSGMSSAITVESPVRLKLQTNEEGHKAYSCSGTPVDCVKLAFDKLLDKAPDLILSGINHGTNSSVSVHYSGTMGAAIEGCIHEVSSIGFSLCDHRHDADFSDAIPYVRTIIEKTIEHGLPKGICLNVNIPKGKINGIEVCRQGHGRWVEEFDERTDPQKRKYYWRTGYYKNMDNGMTDTDNHFLETGKVSVVPIKVDLTDHEFLADLKKWGL
jgi:5'-nucleotidase